MQNKYTVIDVEIKVKLECIVSICVEVHARNKTVMKMWATSETLFINFDGV